MNLTIWDQKPLYLLSPHFYTEGEPNKALVSQIVSVTNLGINNLNGKDTFKTIMFTTPTGYIAKDIFVGFEMNYDFNNLNGDTIGLASTVQGTRLASDLYYLKGGDTFFIERNMTKNSNGVWYDNYVTGGTYRPSYYNNLAIFPIVTFKNATNVKGLKRDGLTIYGSYPNPGSQIINITFELQQICNVKIRIFNSVGQIVTTIVKNNLSGNHSVPIDVSSFSAGLYTYLITTSLGDGIADQFNVSK